MTVCMGGIANQRKVTKWLPFKKLQVMKFACLTLWLGEMCTDANANTVNANNTGWADARQTKHDCIRLFG